MERVAARGGAGLPVTPPVALDHGESVTGEAGAPEFAPQRAPVRRTSAQSVTIDLDRLQRQSIITPGIGRTPMAESFRRVKRHILANIAAAEPGFPANLVMVTSPFANEGKTFCAVNLAISLAMEMERTVLLVDADVAKPSLPPVLGVKIEKGLLDVLFQEGAELADVLCRTNIDKLALLPAGKGRHHATELLASDAMGALLMEMAERYSDRVIIFDSPPLLAASESSVLATRMGQIVMVVEAGKTTEAALKESLTRVESCRNVGLLLNKTEGAGLGYGNYGYGYGYGYGS
ncbi:MAG: AAA family ATPase [Burkholderiales bacterium]|nr:AAA family ATPase [Burkholderiales bacterium]